MTNAPELEVSADAFRLARKNFALISMSPAGLRSLVTLFYNGMFDVNPTLRALFPAKLDHAAERFILALQFVLDNPEKSGPFLEQLGRDHRKFGVEPHHYLEAVPALHAALRDFTGFGYWTDDVDDAWRDICGYIFATLARGAVTDTGRAVWDARVVGVHKPTSDIIKVRLQADAPIPYEAGQYVPVKIPGASHVWRHLSPATPPNAHGELEFHVRHVEGGLVSSLIVTQTQVGEVWRIGGPLGGLGVDRESEAPTLMVGVGTGIAPLRAEVLHLARFGMNPPVHLMVCGRYPKDLYDAEAMVQLSLTNPWLSVTLLTEYSTDLPWLSLQTSGNTEMPEIVNAPIPRTVASYARERHNIQVSASPIMIERIRDALLDDGISPAKISFDPYK